MLCQAFLSGFGPDHKIPRVANTFVLLSLTRKNLENEDKETREAEGPRERERTRERRERESQRKKTNLLRSVGNADCSSINNCQGPTEGERLRFKMGQKPQPGRSEIPGHPFVSYP